MRPELAPHGHAFPEEAVSLSLDSSHFVLDSVFELSGELLVVVHRALVPPEHDRWTHVNGAVEECQGRRTVAAERSTRLQPCVQR